MIICTCRSVIIIKSLLSESLNIVIDTCTPHSYDYMLSTCKVSSFVCRVGIQSKDTRGGNNRPVTEMSSTTLGHSRSRKVTNC